MEINKRFLSVKETAEKYGISIWTIYALIKAEPSFPYRNVGLKRKFVVIADEFEKWLEVRTKGEKHTEMRIPTADELLRLKKT